MGSYKPNLNTVFRSINVAQNRQNGYFWYKFEKERIAYAIVTGLGTEEGVSGAHHHAKFHRPLWLLKFRFTVPKNVKIGNF